MPVLRKCCCCFSLKTGGVILGWLGAVSAALGAVLTIIALCNLDALVKFVMDEAAKKGKLDYDEDVVRTGLQITLGFYLALSLINLISASLLIVGAVKRNRMLLLPWLVSIAVSLVVGGILLFFQIVAAFSESVGAGFFVLFFYSGIFAFELYLWLAIYSLYQQLREEQTNGLGATALVYKSPPADGLPAYSGMA